MTPWFRKLRDRIGARPSGGRPFGYLFGVLTAICVLFLGGARTTHAQGIVDSLISFSMKGIVDGILILASSFIAFEGWLLTQILSFFAVVTTWQSTSNNVVVYDAWVIGRDLVNLFFIVGLIVISFATIFRTFKILPNFHWKQALPRLLIAAILVNLSLGISEVVVLASNRVTVLFAGVTQRYGANLGQILGTDVLITAVATLTDVEPASRNLGNILGPPGKSPENTEWEHYLSFKQNRTNEENAAYDRCLLERKKISVWYLPAFFERSTGKTTSDCIRELAMNRRGERAVSDWERTKVEVAATVERALEYTDEQEANQRLNLLFQSIFTIALLGMVIISIGTAVIFFMLRTVAIWVFMFLSAFAFGFNWLGSGTLAKWWKQFFGWNIFGPFYMLVIIFGMMFLSRSGELMAGVSAGQGIQPMIQTFFLFLFAMIVFVGGLLLAINSSFATAVKSTPILGKAAVKAGVFSALNISAAVGGGLYNKLGITESFQARKEKLAQQYGRIRPEFLRMKSKEEKLAIARRRIGVAGGEQDVLKNLQGRISSQQKSLEARMNAITDSNPAEQARKRTEFLEGQFKRGNKANRLAAGNILMSQGKLSSKDVKKMEKEYSGGFQKAEFGKQVEKGKDPATAFEYAVNRMGANPPPAKVNAAKQKFYGRVLNNPKAFGELDKTYNTDATQRTNLRYAADQAWPPGAPNSKEQKRRNAAEARLRKVAVGDIDRNLLIDHIFS